MKAVNWSYLRLHPGRVVCRGGLRCFVAYILNAASQQISLRIIAVFSHAVPKVPL